MSKSLRDFENREFRFMGGGMHPPWPPLLKGGKSVAFYRRRGIRASRLGRSLALSAFLPSRDVLFWIARH